MTTLKGPEEQAYLRTRERSFLPSDSVLTGVPDYDPFRDRHLERWYHRQRDNTRSKRKDKTRTMRHSPLISTPNGGQKTRLIAPITQATSPPPPVNTHLHHHQHGNYAPQQRHSPNLSPKQAFLAPLEDQPQRVVACKQHPELPATVFSEKFGFLCFQCDVFLHRTWRTAKLKRTPVAQILDPQSATAQQSVLQAWAPDTTSPTQAAGTLLQGDSALEQLLAMEQRKKMSKKSRLLNGQFVPSYSQQYKQEQQAKYFHQQQAAALGSEKAVQLLQKWIRGSIARKQVRQMRQMRDEKSRTAPMDEAAIRIQRIARGRKERANGRLANKQRLKTEFDSRAANSIQSGMRGMLARKKLAQRHAAATVIQRAWRGFWGRRMARRVASGQEEAEEGASILLQSLYRGHSARVTRNQQVEASKRIQRIQRGKLGRKRAMLYADERKSQEMRDNAAGSIQRVFRGRTCRLTIDVYKSNQQQMWSATASKAVLDHDQILNSPKEKGPLFPWEVLGSLHIRDLRFQDETRRMNQERDSMAERVRMSVQNAIDVKEAEKIALREQKDSIIAKKEDEMSKIVDDKARAIALKEDELEQLAADRESAIAAKELEIVAMAEDRTKAEKEMRHRHMDEKEACIQENEVFQSELRQRQREELKEASDEYADAKHALEDKLNEASANNDRLRMQMNQQLDQMREVAKEVEREHVKALHAKDIEMQKELQALREANRSGEAMLATQYDSKEKDVQTKLAAVKQELEELERANQLALQLKETEMRVALEMKEVEMNAQLTIMHEAQQKAAEERARALEMKELEARKALELKDQAMVAKEKEMIQLQRAGSEANLENKQQQEAERQALEAEFAAMQLAKEQELERVRQEAEDKAKALEEEKAAAVKKKELEMQNTLNEFEVTQNSSRNAQNSALQAKEEEMNEALKQKDAALQAQEQEMRDKLAEMEERNLKMLQEQEAMLIAKDLQLKQAVQDKEDEMNSTLRSTQHEALAIAEVGSSALADKDKEMREALHSKDRDLEDREQAISDKQKQMDKELAEAKSQKAMLELEVQAMRAASSRAVLAATRSSGPVTASSNTSKRRNRMEAWKSDILELCAKAQGS